MIKNKFLIFIIFFIISSILIEITLHIIKPSVYEFSKSLGWEVKKNYKKKFKFIDKYGHNYEGVYETNRYGARVVGIKESETKILVIGDSFTMDPHTSNEDSWFGVLKLGLESKLNKSIIVSAIGGGGYGTNQQYLVTKEFLNNSQYSPDIILLQFCVNDFMNNSKEWETKSQNYNQFLRRPYYTENNHLSYDNSLLGKIFRLELFSFLKLPNYILRTFSIIEEKISQISINKKILNNSIEITEILLVKLKQLFPNKEIYVFNCKEDNEYPLNQWVNVLKDSGYIVLENPSKDMKKKSKYEKIFYVDGGHYNLLGNKILGNSVLKEISKYFNIN